MGLVPTPGDPAILVDVGQLQRLDPRDVRGIASGLLRERPGEAFEKPRVQIRPAERVEHGHACLPPT
jgi:hypothetical protein